MFAHYPDLPGRVEKLMREGGAGLTLWEHWDLEYHVLDRGEPCNAPPTARSH